MKVSFLRYEYFHVVRPGKGFKVYISCKCSHTGCPTSFRIVYVTYIVVFGTYQKIKKE